MNLPAENRPLIIGLAIAIVVLMIGAILYLVEGHPKHALLAIALAVACGVGLWFTTGPTAQAS